MSSLDDVEGCFQVRSSAPALMHLEGCIWAFARRSTSSPKEYTVSERSFADELVQNRFKVGVRDLKPRWLAVQRTANTSRMRRCIRNDMREMERCCIRPASAASYAAQPRVAHRLFQAEAYDASTFDTDPV